MPTIDVEIQELERFLGIDLQGDMAKLDEILAYVKGEVKAFNQKDGTASLEMKDTNRPDLWSVEGLSRALRGYLGQQKKPDKYLSKPPVLEVNVDARLQKIRPFIACAVVKNAHLIDDAIKGIMHLQDKLDQTYGRSRQKASIGIYNFDLITPPIEYTAVLPSSVCFVPLGFNEKMGLNEILERHPKGVEFGGIVKRHTHYPMLFDGEGKILSFPPIINSNDLGKITVDSRNLLVEVTGTSRETVLGTLNLVTLALIDRGGVVFEATINYPQNAGYKEKTVVTPCYAPRRFDLSVEYTNRLLGLDLPAKKIAALLGVAGLGVEKIGADSVCALVPCWRVDVMHQVDIVEDVAIAYGYNNIEAVWRDLPTSGRAKAGQWQIDVARELMVGLGFQEVMMYTLTNQESLFDKMNVARAQIVEVANPKIVTMTCLRNWLMPSLMEFLGNNVSVEFPQKIFELGKVSLLDDAAETKTRDEDWLCALSTHANANFTEIKSALDAFLRNLGVEWQIKEAVHPSFIEGRVGRVIVGGVDVGVVGEINPAVLEAWRLETPVAAFEVNLQRILSLC
jgi:phenylalanyl-tRNA synthetase beta chain